jgi:glutaredoxin
LRPRFCGGSTGQPKLAKTLRTKKASEAHRFLVAASLYWTLDIAPMIPTHRLLQHSCRITLFTRANCSLCTKAKETLSTVWDARPFIFREVDVIAPGEKGWRDLYEFDTPVVRRLLQPWVRELIIVTGPVSLVPKIRLLSISPSSESRGYIIGAILMVFHFGRLLR